MCTVYHIYEPSLNNGDPSTSSSFVPLRSDTRSFEGLRRTSLRMTILFFQQIFSAIREHIPERHIYDIHNNDFPPYPSS
jgi:hypothetical protein